MAASNTSPSSRANPAPALWVSKIKSLLNSRKRVAAFFIVVLLIGFFGWRTFGSRQQKIQYQTAQATKGTLVTSVSASGNIISGNNVSIVTSAGGIVDHVYVKLGDSVVRGQKIADLTLDQDTQQRQASAWASYLSAKNQLASAQANINSLQAAEFKANQTFINDAVARGLVASDPTYIQENASWLQAEANYKNQTGVINQAQASLTSSFYSYQQSSSVITAPVSGTVSDLVIAPGIPLAGQSNSTGGSSSLASQKIGTISTPQGHVIAVVNVAEIDVPNVSTGEKATLTLSAFANVTFTGKVLVVDTNGQVSSGVATYAATIVLDSTNNKIYPNMAVDAKIITNIKNDVVLVPSGAIQTTSGQSMVRVLNNGQVASVTVQIGDSNDTETEVTAGLTGSETVVTGATVSGSTSTSQTGVSPFSAFGGNRGFGGGGSAAGGAVRRVTGD